MHSGNGAVSKVSLEIQTRKSDIKHSWPAAATLRVGQTERAPLASDRRS